jgi:NADP-dependent 3-hydroxy acid dehydrogenase YdfG
VQSKAGWKVTLAARRESALKEAASGCPGPTCLVVVDVSKEADVEKMFQMTLKAFGQ